ncbi:MAG TPA: AI-2E family transporter [Armatimonadota bacterium]|jgi:predicted PurR-regulated permease PerM
MSPALLTPLIVGAWILVVLLLVGGAWFVERHRLRHQALLIALGLAGVFLAIHLRELVVMLVLAGVVAYILDGPVERLSARMPRPIAISLVYVGLALALLLVGAFVIPAAVHQATLFLSDLPRYTELAKGLAGHLTSWYGGAPTQVQNSIDAGLEQLEAASQTVTGQMAQLLLALLGWTVRGILILVMSIYLLADKARLKDQSFELFPTRHQHEARDAVHELMETFGRYLRGQMTVIAFVAITVTLVLLAFRIPYAIFIGTLAGILEVIPYFGAFAGAVPAVALGLMKSPTTGIALMVMFILINQIEGHVVIPMVMGHHLSMRPLSILLLLIAGERLFGVVGMIVAVPSASLFRVLLPRLVAQYRLLRSLDRPGNGNTDPEAAGAAAKPPDI